MQSFGLQLTCSSEGADPTKTRRKFLTALLKLTDPIVLNLWSWRAPNSTETQKELKWQKGDSKVTPKVPPQIDSKVTQSGVAPANQIKGQNEKFMQFAHFCEFWCFSLGKQARFTLVPECPCEKFMNWSFLWFGLPGPLLTQKWLKHEVWSHFWVTFGSLWGRPAWVTFESLLGHFKFFLCFCRGRRYADFTMLSPLHRDF